MFIDDSIYDETKSKIESKKDQPVVSADTPNSGKDDSEIKENAKS